MAAACFRPGPRARLQPAMRIVGTGEFSRVMVGVAAVMVVYVAALLVSDYFDIRSPHSPLSREVRSVAAALESHRQSRGAYPVLNDRPLVELKKQLVEGGYLKSDSADLAGPDKAARYASFNGKSYGLLFHFDPTGPSPKQPCLIEVGDYETGWWAQPAKCPF
jgi:hypothetical protein